MAKIYRRSSDGMYVGQISLGFEVNAQGKKVRARRTFYGATRTVVKNKIEDATLREGGKLKPNGAAGTLEEWMDIWLAEQKHQWAPTTFDNNSRAWNRAKAYIGGKKLATVGANDISALYSALRNESKPIAPSTLQKLHNALHKAFEDAAKRNMVFGRNPLGLVRPGRVQSKEHTPLTMEQTRKLLAACSASGNRFEAAVVLAITCGMRLGEILGLRWSDIHEDDHYLTVRRSLREFNGRFSFSDGKSESARRKRTLGTLALAALRRRRKVSDHTSPSDLIFCTSTGRPLSRAAFRKRTYLPLLAAARVPHARFHDLRHGFATLLLLQGTPVKVVSEALGHANPGITSRLYQHVTGELQAEASLTLDKALRAAR
jgi:integrase